MRINILFVVLMLSFRAAGQRPELPGDLQSHSFDTLRVQELLRHAEAVSYEYPDSAAQICGELLRECMQYGYQRGVIRACIGLGMIAEQQGNYYDALLNYYNALSFCDSSDAYRNYHSTIYNGIGVVFTRLDQREYAVNSFITALRYAENPAEGVKRLHPGYIYNNLGNVFTEVKRYEEAVYYYRKALKSIGSEGTADPKLYAGIQMNMGNLHFRHKAYDSAVAAYETAIRTERAHDLKEGLARSLLNYSLLLLDLDQPERAGEVLGEVLMLGDGTRGSTYTYGVALRTMGNVCMELKDYSCAVRYFRDALGSKGITGRERQLVLERLSIAYMEGGKYPEGWQSLYDSYRLKDSIDAKESSLRIAELETRYRAAEARREVLQQQAELDAQARRIDRKNRTIILISSGALSAGLLFWGLYRQRVRKERTVREMQRLKNIMEGEERERRRMAGELHDGVNSQLTAVKSFLLAAQQAYPQLGISEDFRQAKQMLSGTSDEVRQIAHNLAPDELLQKGLKAAISEFCAGIFYGTGTDTDVQVYGDYSNVPGSVSLPIYRITQELLHNIRKHARATVVSVLLSRTDGELTLIVEDNGTGLEPARLEGAAGSGMGLAGIRERVKAFQGKLLLESSQVSGTTFTVVFPIV